jgi:hypothetical protein
MTHPAVQFVLDAVEKSWPAGSYSDIPLERVDGDNSEQLDDNIRSHTAELQDDNYVEAVYADRDDTPIGTEYDLRVDELAVRVRVAGLHKSKYGYIDPSASLPPATAGDPVPFYGGGPQEGLVNAVRQAIHEHRTFPSPNHRIDFTSLRIDNTPGPRSFEYGDYYLFEFRVVFEGYEAL